MMIMMMTKRKHLNSWAGADVCERMDHSRTPYATTTLVNSAARSRGQYCHYRCHEHYHRGHYYRPLAVAVIQVSLYHQYYYCHCYYYQNQSQMIRLRIWSG